MCLIHYEKPTNKNNNTSQVLISFILETKIQNLTLKLKIPDFYFCTDSMLGEIRTQLLNSLNVCDE